MIASVVLYDLRGGGWVVLPLAWATERLCNGFWVLVPFDFHSPHECNLWQKGVRPYAYHSKTPDR
jgi:hypothetical protein